MDRKDEIELLTTQLKAINIRLAQLEAAAEQDKRLIERCIGTTAGIKKGDRVNIVNKLKKPSTWSDRVEWDQEDAQKATVTHIYKEQVHFITDNGVTTWRAINNLRKRIEE